MMRWSALLIVASLSLPLAVAKPQGSVPTATPTLISGVVIDSARRLGISGAMVSLEGTTLRAFTDERGQFQLSTTGRARGALRVQRLGFRPGSIVMDSLGPGLVVSLATNTPSLAVVVVRADRTRATDRLSGYYQRLERRASGIFITRDDLERERPPQLSDLFRRVAGVQMGRNRRSNMGSVRLRGRDCAPLIWLDGAALGSSDVDIDSFAPESLEGIELYLGTMTAPQRFQSVRNKSDCGTVVLWSRGTEPATRRGDPAIALKALEALLAAHTVYSADEVDVPAALDSTTLKAFAYPAALRGQAVTGIVVAEFVVDTEGHAEEENFTVLGSTNALLSQSVQDSIRGAAFRPALRAGQAVRQLVRQPFEFQPLAR